MKKVTLLSLVAASVLFTACGEDAKKAASDMAASATQSAKEAASSAMDSAKEAASGAMDSAKDAASGAVDSAKDAASSVAEKAGDVKDAAVEKAEGAVDAAKETVASAEENAAGKAAFAKCAGCHGADGKTKALGKSEEIAGQSAADLETKLSEYKAGTRNVAGMGTLMKGQVASMSDEDIKAVSEYVSGL